METQSVRDELGRIDAMAQALRELPAATLADHKARLECYARAGVSIEPGEEAADDAAAWHLAVTYRDLYPGDRTAIPRVIDAGILFARLRAFVLLGRELAAEGQVAHG